MTTAFTQEQLQAAFPVNWIEQTPLSRFRRPFRFIVEDVYFRYFKLSFSREDVSRNMYGVGLYNPSIMQSNLGTYYLRHSMSYVAAKEGLKLAIGEAVAERYPAFSLKQEKTIAGDVLSYMHHADEWRWTLLQKNARNVHARGNLWIAGVWNNIVDHLDEEQNLPEEGRGEGKVSLPVLPAARERKKRKVIPLDKARHD